MRSKYDGEHSFFYLFSTCWIFQKVEERLSNIPFSPFIEKIKREQPNGYWICPKLSVKNHRKTSHQIHPFVDSGRKSITVRDKTDSSQ